MAGIFKIVLFSSIMILGIIHMLGFKSVRASPTSQSEMDEFDSFFEGSSDQEEIEELIPHRERNTPIEETEDKKVVEEPSKYYYPPPEPIPEFNSSAEKYIYYFRKYMIEIWILVFVAFFIANFVIGKNANCKVAARWLSEIIQTLNDNFQILGFGEESNYSLSQIKYDEFEFYASGRDNCKYLFMSLRTKKRQDLITGGMMGLLWPDVDKVILDIPIEAELPLELLICRKYNVKKTQQEMPNINKLIAPLKVDKLSATNLAVLAENSEIPEIVLSNKVTSAIIKYEKYLEFLHITDQKVYTNYNLVLKVEIFFGENEEEYKESAKLIEMVLDLVDHIVNNVKLPERVLDQAKKNRSAEEKKREKEARDKREEEIQQKKDEKERELREKLKKMDPEQRKKMEEKIKKDNKKKELRQKNKLIKF